MGAVRWGFSLGRHREFGVLWRQAVRYEKHLLVCKRCFLAVILHSIKSTDEEIDKRMERAVWIPKPLGKMIVSA